MAFIHAFYEAKRTCLHYFARQTGTAGQMCCGMQAKEALQSPYFDDLDKETVDALESDVIRAREG